MTHSVLYGYVMLFEPFSMYENGTKVMHIKQTLAKLSLTTPLEFVALALPKRNIIAFNVQCVYRRRHILL